MHTWKPTAAGIFNILSGLVTLIGALVLVVLAFGAGGFMLFVGGESGDPIAPLPFAIGMGMFFALALLAFVLGAVSLKGGMEALGRGSWGWAVAGSIATMIACFPFGILAVVLTIMSESELQNATPTIA